MQYEKEPLPQKPEWAIITAVKQAALYAAGGAVVWAISAKIPFFKKEIPKPIALEAAEGAGIMGAIGLIFGYGKGVRDHAEYPLKVENIKLREQVMELKNDKSFAQTIAAEKIQAKIDIPGR